MLMEIKADINTSPVSPQVEIDVLIDVILCRLAKVGISAFRLAPEHLAALTIFAKAETIPS